MGLLPSVTSAMVSCLADDAQSIHQWCQSPLRGSWARGPDDLRSRVRRRGEELGAAGTVFPPTLSHEYLQCSRLSPFRSAGGSCRVFAAPGGGGYPRRPRLSADRQGARDRPLDGKLRDAALRSFLASP